VVPLSLLEFSRSVLRSRFSAIIRKPIYTFQFDRFMEVTPAIAQLFVTARRTGAIIITTPKSLKSFMLKYVELLYDLDRASGGQQTSRSVSELRTQSHECVKVLNLWREATLLMDEVDLILHPLKSELNYPVGERNPLDFTENKIGKGLRWEVPYYLLDAVCFASHGKIKESYKSSREMVDILTSLKQVVEQGVADAQVQSVPHFVLLYSSFYHTKMKPLLARWMLLFCFEKGVSGVTDQQALKYLLKGPADLEAAAPVQRKLSTEFTKLLNLGYDWLNSSLPHVLGKINRVGYGLLSSNDIQALLEVNAHVCVCSRFTTLYVCIMIIYLMYACRSTETCRALVSTSRCPSWARTCLLRHPSSHTPTSSSGSLCWPTGADCECV
jgi:hypothetical protein